MTPPEFEISRRWWFPIFVEVWECKGEAEHWRKGPYTRWLRRGVFFRRSTAERFVDWLRAPALTMYLLAGEPGRVRRGAGRWLRRS